MKSRNRLPDEADQLMGRIILRWQRISQMNTEIPGVELELLRKDVALLYESLESDRLAEPQAPENELRAEENTLSPNPLTELPQELELPREEVFLASSQKQAGKETPMSTSEPEQAIMNKPSLAEELARLYSSGSIHHILSPQQEKPLSETLSYKGLSLFELIDLNARFRFIQDVFSGNGSLFETTLRAMDESTNKEEACRIFSSSLQIAPPPEGQNAAWDEMMRFLNKRFHS